MGCPGRRGGTRLERWRERWRRLTALQRELGGGIERKTIRGRIEQRGEVQRRGGDV